MPFGVAECVLICWHDACFTARKILSKILSDRISLACSKFGVLRGDNFSVLYSTSMLFPVFVVNSVVENAFEKNREIWLVLQNMWKVYDSVGWPHLKANLWHIKMCERFIGFFGNIYKDRVNRVMTDFGLSDGYSVHDGLNQSEHLCGYRVDSKFVAKTGRVEGVSGMMSYLAAGVFIDNIIWIENCQASIQYALNIASEFFEINNISINNDKTVAILINQGVKIAFLSICGQPISIAKKGKTHHYLGIFLSMESLSKPSVFKAYSNVWFFVNIVLRKTITDKQFSYLVLVDVMVKKGLKSKAGLPHDFPNAALHHPSLKIAALVSFSNASGVLGHLFNHRFLDLQVLGWASLDLLQFPVKLHVSPVNNFLAGIVKIFLSNELFLANNLPNAFRSPGHFPLSLILGSSEYFNSICSLKHFGVAFSDWILNKRGCVLDWKTFCCWKKLDPRGPMPYWFSVVSKFMLVQGFSASSSAGFAQPVDMNVLDSKVFFLVKDGLHDIWSSCFEMYTDESLRNAGLVNAACGATTFFLVLDRSIGVVVGGLLSSTLAELQAVALALKKKDLKVVWVKVKSHFGILGNIKADLVAGDAARSPFFLLAGVYEHYLVAKNMAISGNTCHFVWHPNSYMLAEFTGWKTSNLHSYLIKAVHRCLLVAVRKRLYNRGYPGILCLLCGGVEFSDHAFTCPQDVVIHNKVLVEASAHWVLVAGFCDSSSSAVLQTLSVCSLDSVFENKKQAIGKVVSFVRFHRVWMEKTGLVADSGVVSDLSRDISSILLDRVVRMLGVVESFAVSFGHCLPCCFFSGLDSVVSVNIGV
ncbi:hypothetical protein G9A89_017048 [Geosiphon pyriformis]|nr:hypothetical protein G9A89_017048 [Geosiphon pyriformis]